MSVTDIQSMKPAAAPPTTGTGGGGLLAVTVQMAWNGIIANKLRSFLTMLGVIIGVGAVIVAISIGQGSRAAVAESIQRLGTNVLTVFPGSQRRGGIMFGGGTSITLKPEDAEAILKGCPSVARVSPTVNRSLQVKYKDKNNNNAITGTGTDYPVVSAHPVAQGRYFTAEEVRSLRRVVVVGSNVVKDLFDQQSPIGKKVRIANQNFEVVGVLKAKGGTGFRNPDDALYVPFTTAMRRLFGLQSVNNITVQAKTFGLLGRAQTEVEDVLRKEHKIGANGTPDFTVFNQADLAETQNAQQDTFSSLITYLAIVSLVVGGIGIMNIMLVSVTERTREIGIRKAIGAKRRDILTQFLLEALFLSLVGGLLGVALGISGSNWVSAANNWRVQID
ncbi:MAG: ABC transporter permease, partial [Capsulimonadales bacterium]|nr:ABC transporter permease [Capsulimonadales bacterium]